MRRREGKMREKYKCVYRSCYLFCPFGTHPIKSQINSVQHVVRALLRKLEEKTGLVFCCLASGAEPARNGRTVVFSWVDDEKLSLFGGWVIIRSVHSIGSGRTFNGNKTFSTFDPRFHTVVVPIFHEFVHACICKCCTNSIDFASNSPALEHPSIEIGLPLMTPS